MRTGTESFGGQHEASKPPRAFTLHPHELTNSEREENAVDVRRIPDIDVGRPLSLDVNAADVRYTTDCDRRIADVKWKKGTVSARR